ncbi:MAG: DNA polymerase IV [Paeniclostridium sordellii]|uniref:DNA polymerase IV n=2 Tax=Paeniclostridium hominis TaxID=2764329 RepID=A0ABR7K762_9FIRM|nr:MULTISPECIES: DNA polymerase IV [Paeniclostridium]MBC6004933.1 DNA polymerase IV [Paeniclostridium hominis]MDU2591847.1 DNA polymerase IV [Paeniclostridium sordellii]
MYSNRKIIHIDMDAFYASVEQRDNKELRGKPVIVGGSPESRGVVATCSYEARKFGIHSAMPSKVAYVRCPHAIFVPPRFDVYHKVSCQIREIFKRYTDIIEPLSLDEAYLDVTENKKGIEYASVIAKRIKHDIYKEIGITSFAGVSYNKFLAKIASDYQKPNGLTVITPEKAQEFIDKLPIKKFFGIGKVTEKTLKMMGINNGYDLRNMELIQLETIFKKKGYDMYNFARGIDHRPVKVSRERKSVGAESTFISNVNFDSDELNEHIKEVVKDVYMRLNSINKSGKTITVKVKYEDFQQVTKRHTLKTPIHTYDDILGNTNILIEKIKDKNKQIRLIGVSISNLSDKEKEMYTTISLFDKL